MEQDNNKPMSQNQNLQNQHIPILSDLITAGNPELKLSEEKKRSLAPQSANLTMRIDEIESAIGQDTSGPVGRAFAIRAEEEFENIGKN